MLLSIVLPGIGLVLVSYILLSYVLPVVKAVNHQREIAKSLDHLSCPVPKFHWLMGSIPYIGGPTEKGLLENIAWIETHPYWHKIFYSRWGAVVNVNHPDIAKVIMRTPEGKPVVDFGGYQFIKQWIGDGLLNSSGEKWFRNRRLLTPAFHFDILKPYMKVYNDCTQCLLDKIQDLTDNHQDVNILRENCLCTLDIILKCAFSYDGDVQRQSSASPYAQAVMSLSDMIVKRIFYPPHWVDFFYYRTQEGKQFLKARQISRDVAEEVIGKRKAVLAERGEDSMLASKKYVDFLDILLLARDEHGNGLTDEEIRDEVETFMFEGHDTTKSGISFILYNLARHPEIQAKARQEVDDLLEGRESDEILWGDLANMPYLTKCIKESLRLHPPVPFVSRQLTQPMEIEGHTFIKGTIIDIFIWNIHHHPKVWGPDHMTYDPERFNEENMRNMDAYAYVPFSAGPRNCIGQNFAMNEMKVVAAKVLRNFKFCVDESHVVELKAQLILTAKDDIKLKFTRRVQGRD